MTLRGPIRDPALYRRMSEPHASAAEGNAAVDAFAEGVRALREKHRLRDVVVIAQVVYLDQDGQETIGHATQNIGDPLQTVGMLAVAYGREKQRVFELLDRASNPPSARGGS